MKEIIAIPSIEFALFGLQAASPSIAALITVCFFDGSKGVSRFLAKCYKYHNLKKMFLYGIVSILIVLLLGSLSKIVYIGIEGTHGRFFTRISVKQAIVVLWALIAEEMGWRGFLQEEIDVRNKAFIPLLIGLIWALWHYHFYLTGSIGIPVWLFVIGCVTESFIYYYITVKMNGNIVIVSIWHFMGNLVGKLFAMSPEMNGNALTLYGMYTFLVGGLGIFSFVRLALPARSLK